MPPLPFRTATREHGHDSPCQHAGEVYDRCIMNDHQDHRGSHGPRQEDHRHEGASAHGPADTGFLNLEMSKVILADAEALATEVARDLLREAIRERLNERLGDRLRAVGRLVADELADDVEANLAIEAKIAERRSTRKGLDERLREALASPEPDDPKTG